MIRAIIACLALSATGPAFAEPVVPLRLNGPDGNRINLIIMGDGYAAGDLNRFATEAAYYTDYLFTQQPFKEYANFFNVYRIDVTSNDSGVDHLEWQQLKDTALGTAFGCGGVQRYICFDRAAVDDVLSRSELPADRDLVVILVNDSFPGGSGGRYAVGSTGGGVESMVHEIAHTFGLLADEYVGGGTGGNCRNTTEPNYVNVTRQVARDAIKWKHWIADTTPIPTTTLASGVPGLYEGGHTCATGIYRPTNNSKMRALGVPFEQVNSEQLVRRVYNFVSPIDRVLPAVREQRLRRGSRAEFIVERPQPASHDLEVAWTLDAAPVGDGHGALTLDTAPLAPGRYTLRVTVRDKTSFVRHDPAEALVETFEWTIEITP
jgi:hypothetical protein